MQMVNNAKTYDWQTWRMGLFRSFMSGSAMALMTLGGAAVMELPRKVSLLLMAWNFVSMGLYRMGEFLHINGAPTEVTPPPDSPKP